MQRGSEAVQQFLIGGRALRLEITPKAEQALGRRREPLDIEMELYFSCLIRKRVNFLPGARADAAATAPLRDAVTISFRPVMSRVCLLSAAADDPQLEALPTEHADRLMPRWLRLDYRRGRWCAEFGY